MRYSKGKDNRWGRGMGADAPTDNDQGEESEWSFVGAAGESEA